ncbi:MAG: SH3 domain-containing protein [Lachnospiraceae bacterium]
MSEFEKRKKKLLRLTALTLAVLIVVTGFCGFSGYSRAATSKGVVTTHGARLNVRTGPSTDYRVITSLSNGTTVTVTGSSGSWYRISYGSGKSGYVYSKYLKLEGDNITWPVTAKVTEGGVPLNLRQKATTASAILAKIPRGSSIRITGQYNSSWYTAEYNGKSGYVYAYYIAMPATDSTSVSSGGGQSSASSWTYSKISLNVPLYSQYDSRWSGLKLGKSSATIAKSGCVVCGMAQIETYLSGSQVTPADMLKQLSFDGEGRVYWPAGYKSYTGSAYLSAIYTQLQYGNPVLVGGFTPSGKQHWVLVTGYNKNGNSLSASNFVVNDCLGRYSTLADYQSTYSRFYKIVYKSIK